MFMKIIWYIFFRVSFDTLMFKNKKSKSNKCKIMGPMPSVAMPKKVYRPLRSEKIIWEDMVGEIIWECNFYL